MYNIYIKRAAELFGITHTREIYEKAIEKLKDHHARYVAMPAINFICMLYYSNFWWEKVLIFYIVNMVALQFIMSGISIFRCICSKLEICILYITISKCGDFIHILKCDNFIHILEM